MSDQSDGGNVSSALRRVIRVASVTGIAAAALVGAQIHTPNASPAVSPNIEPIAHAGLDQTVVVGQHAVLDASKSADLDGDRLEFYWSLSLSPDGSLAELSGSFDLRPRVFIDLPGTYMATLVVFDGHHLSAPASVKLSTTNSAPMADAGPDQTVRVGDMVVLDSGKSRDPDGDTIAHAWKMIEIPAGSRAVLSSLDVHRPSFYVDEPGRYVVRLSVSDGRLSSNVDDVVVSTINSRPIAMPGSTMRAMARQRIALDGRTSTDPDNDALSFAWSVLSVPRSGSARLTDPSGATTMLELGQPGLYLIQLVVSDGQLASAPSSVVIEAVGAGTSPISAEQSSDTKLPSDVPPVITAHSSARSTTAAQAVDSDGDGVDDPMDNCLFVSNPSQLDTDFDGYGNACDADLNNDGFINLADLLLLGNAFFSTPGSPSWNPNADFNGDGNVNFGDLNILGASFFMRPGPSGRDVDEDGIPDASDNCRDAANPDQLDTDADRFGNACDADFNNDGMVNFADLEIMRNAFFSTPSAPNWNPDTDLNGDGTVNFADLAIMESSFFGPPGPSGLLPFIAEFDPASATIGSLVNITGANFVTGFGFVPRVVLQKQGGGEITAPLGQFSDNSIAFTIPTGATDGVITVVVEGASTASIDVLDIVPSSDFSLTVGPSPAQLIQGQSVAYSVRLESANGFSQLATLQVSGVPAGLTARFVPPMLAANRTSVLTIADPTGVAVPASANLSITASATVDGFAVSDVSSVQLDILPVSTAFIGQAVIADTMQTPLAGVTISFLGVDGAGNPTGCTAETVSDAAGNFMLANLPDECMGPQLVRFNGLTVTNAPGQYAGVDLLFSITGGQVAVSPVLIHLPRIDDKEIVCIEEDAASDRDYFFTTIPNLSATVYAGTTFSPHPNYPAPTGVCSPDEFPLIAIDVPVDRLPDEMPPGNTIEPFIVAFQPANATASQPVAVSFPNVLNTLPGTNMELSTLDPTQGIMVVYGTGTVSPNGTQIVPDFNPATPGMRYGLVHFDWHGPRIPPPPPGPPTVPPCPLGTCCPTAGKPIVIGSGLEVISETDIVIGGGRGTISIGRTYRTLSMEPGPFGIGSNHDYGYRLDTNDPLSTALINLITPDGNRLPFAFDGAASYINESVPGIRAAVMTVDGNGEVDLRWKDGTIFHFVPRTTLLGSTLEFIKDSNENKITLVRNPARAVQITEIIDPVGRNLMLTYDAADRIIRVTDPIGRRISYTYNGFGTLATFTDAEGGKTQYSYDAATRLTQITDARGVVIAQNTFDENGRVIQQVQADNGVITFDYELLNPDVGDSPVRKTTVTNALGHRTIYRFNPQGFLTDVTDALGQTRTFSLEAGTNLLLGVNGTASCEVCGNSAAGDLIFAYDEAGNITSRTDDRGNSTTFTYEPIFNKLASSTDPLGGITSFVYDSAGNLLVRTDPNEHPTSFVYDEFGLLIEQIDPLGARTTYTYDPFGNLVTITNPLGNSRSFQYDLVSRSIQRIDALGARTTTAYDNLDQIVSITDARSNSTTTQYDEVGNRRYVTDARGNSIEFTFDSINRVIARTDSLDRVDTWTYDLNGNVSSFVDRRGQTSVFVYDLLDRLVAESYTDGSEVTRAYDAHGRLNQIEDSAGGGFSFSYMPTGDLSAALGPTGTVEYVRDALGRVERRKVIGQGGVDYAYDAAGNLLSAVAPSAGITYVYDERNRSRTAVRTNGVVTEYGYDIAGRMVTLTHSNLDEVFDAQVYVYDAVGNRIVTAMDVAQPLATQAENFIIHDRANLLLQRGQVTYTYDENGNRLTETDMLGTAIYRWDVRNRLTSIDSADAINDFQYDFSGTLLMESSGTTNDVVVDSRSFLVDDLTNVIAITDHKGIQVSVLTGRSIDEHLAVMRGDGHSTYGLRDAVNSTVAMVDESAGLIGESRYEPFGTTVSTGGAYPFQFTGRTPVVGEKYNIRARYYDPIASRFVSEDPVDVRMEEPNLFVYAKNNPIRFTDPLGLRVPSQACGDCKSTCTLVGRLSGVAGRSVALACKQVCRRHPACINDECNFRIADFGREFITICQQCPGQTTEICDRLEFGGPRL